MRHANLKCPSLSAGLCFAGLLACCMSAGCGNSPGPQGPRGDVAMTITYDGTPVAAGLVDLINSETGDGGGGELSSDGTVSIANVAFGKYTVIVRPPEPDPTPDQSMTSAGTEQDKIPPEFQSPQTSPLTLEVGDDKQSQDVEFDLKETK